MKLTYAVVFERAPNNYAAYVPELPGCISTGKDWNEMQWMIREAIEFHIEGMVEYGESVPVPTMSIRDAMEYHLSLDDDYELDPEWGITVDESVVETETTFGFVDVEVSTLSAAAEQVAERVSSR